MVKLKAVNREQVTASNERLEALLAQDPQHQEEKRQREEEETPREATARH